jgi:small subunit ribosomal protein S20
MARHPSAEKRNRQNKKRRVRNVGILKAFRGVTKEARALLASKDPSKAKEPVAKAIRAIEKAKSKGVVHWRTAARAVSRLAKAAVRAAK